MARIRIVLLAAAVAAPWFAASTSLPAAARSQESDRETRRAPAPNAADPLAVALGRRIAGKTSLDDVRVDASWSREGRSSSVRIYGDGTVFCDAMRQVSVERTEVVAVLAALRKARFGAMPDHFGQGDEDEKNDGPRLKGRVAVRLGEASKSVLQLVDGDQSGQLEALAARILGVCRAASGEGIGAESLDDGLRKVASGALVPQALEITLQRRTGASDESSGSWILKLEGRRAVDSRMSAGKARRPSPRVLLSDAEFRSLATLLAGANPGEIPINVYASEYTDLGIVVLDRSRLISGRRFLHLTPETHGEKQKAFDRIVEALRALHERVETGAAKPPPPSSRPK